MTYIPKVSVYECKNCGFTTQPDVDHDGTPYCPECGDEVRFAHEREPEWVSVAMYATDQAYGGPEEGGWWYTVGHIVNGTLRHFERCDFPQVEDYCNMIERRYPDCISEIYAEKTVAYFPAKRPIYC